jgi:hypothetical protein
MTVMTEANKEKLETKAEPCPERMEMNRENIEVVDEYYFTIRAHAKSPRIF